MKLNHLKTLFLAFFGLSLVHLPLHVAQAGGQGNSTTNSQIIVTPNQPSNSTVQFQYAPSQPIPPTGNSFQYAPIQPIQPANPITDYQLAPINPVIPPKAPEMGYDGSGIVLRCGNGIVDPGEECDDTAPPVLDSNGKEFYKCEGCKIKYLYDPTITVDYQNQKFITIVPTLITCSDNSNCSSKDPCTKGTCESGTCNYSKIPNCVGTFPIFPFISTCGAPNDPADKCNDHNACTEDSCKLIDPNGDPNGLKGCHHDFINSSSSCCQPADPAKSIIGVNADCKNDPSRKPYEEFFCIEQTFMCAPVTCSANADCKDDNVCTDEICTNGICTHVPNSASCEDGDACTIGDSCQGGNGKCKTGMPKTCASDACSKNTCNPSGVFGNCDKHLWTVCMDDGNACTSSTCDPIHGCNVPLPNGTSCKDSDACNGAETCLNGSCEGGTPLNCDNGNVCDGIESCNQAKGCMAGMLLKCNDGNVCNGVESCDPVKGCTPGTPLKCDNANVCDGIESCNTAASGCVAGKPLNCDDNDACTTDTCDTKNGCKNSKTPNCKSCSSNTDCHGFTGKCCSGVCKHKC